MIRNRRMTISTRFIGMMAAAVSCLTTQTLCFAPSHARCTRRFPVAVALSEHRQNGFDATKIDLPSTVASTSSSPALLRRRNVLKKAASGVAALSSIFLAQSPLPAQAKCTDIESCREEGERRVEADLKLNPIVKLPDGVRYRAIRPPTSSSDTKTVNEGSNIDLAYSISTASGQYMYSKGFGFEKVEFAGRQESDLGLDSMRVLIGKHNVPVGIEYALVGMKRGERRRVELPPDVGFETSNWSPEPTTRRGKAQIEGYKRKLAGFGSQPPFPAETVWDIEVLQIR